MQSRVQWRHHTGSRKPYSGPQEQCHMARQGAPSSLGGQATLIRSRTELHLCSQWWFNGGSAKGLRIENWASVSTKNERNHIVFT